MRVRDSGGLLCDLCLLEMSEAAPIESHQHDCLKVS